MTQEQLSTKFAQVAVGVPLPQLFDYQVAGATVAVGQRVLVPFRQKKMVGLVMNLTDEPSVAADKIKPIISVFTDVPPLPPDMVALIKFCATYYHWPIGMVAAAVLPAQLRREKTVQLMSGYRLTSEADLTALNNPTPNINKIVDLLQTKQTATVAQIKRVVKTVNPSLKRLMAQGVVEQCFHRLPAPADVVAQTVTLTLQQQRVVTLAQLNKGFVAHLLFGATGSGKSEVYFNLAKTVLEKKQQVLFLTPEIHLTPQLQEKIAQRFPAQRLVILHSGLAAGERARNWLMAMMGEADIVLGTRSAVFVPMSRLGLIVIDEEHDDSYKQDSQFNFSAVQVAAWRAKHNGIPLIAGSATPSLENYKNAIDHKWRLLRMPKRLNDADLTFELITDEPDAAFHGMMPDFIERIKHTLKRKQQVLIFINRRAFSPTMLCRDCQQAIGCNRCSTTMAVHKQRGCLMCHWCGWVTEMPIECPACQGKLNLLGVGTQRIEEALLKLFPKTALLRLDGDAKIDETINDDFYSRFKLIVGTQIIAKGHNLPNLGLIGILGADAGLLSTDMRAEERLLALLSQVIGRGTRNKNGCHVMMQTALATHPFFSELQNDDVEKSWQRQLQQRQQVRMPPFGYLALLRAQHKNTATLNKFMQMAAKTAKSFAQKKVAVYDPIAPPIEKVNLYHRQQLLLHAATRTQLHEVIHQTVNALSEQASGAVRWSIEVDPREV